MWLLRSRGKGALEETERESPKSRGLATGDSRLAWDLPGQTGSCDRDPTIDPKLFLDTLCCHSANNPPGRT
jgi:hypothetical protein